MIEIYFSYHQFIFKLWSMKYMKYGTMYGKLVEKYKWGVLSNGEISQSLNAMLLSYNVIRFHTISD